jgi:hypothetical protein
MVEVILSMNSRICQGTIWPKPGGATAVRGFDGCRMSPGDGCAPRLDPCFVEPGAYGPMVLEPPTERRIDPTLTYRPVHLDPLTDQAAGGIDLNKIAPKARVY